MLRRKLMFNFAPLIGLLALTAVAAIWLLQVVLSSLGTLGPDHSAAELEAQVRMFRWIVLGLALVFVVVINVSVVIVLRMAAMVLRPMEQLIDATHALADGHFDHRVGLVQGSKADEFGLLATAFDNLAARLQTDEQRKMEMLGQVSLALNHELNNCIAIIGLQLRMVSRQASRCPEMESHLRQIHESLGRMTSAVTALRNVRRIVLTDYIPGMKMLDLERSASPDDLEPAHDASIVADRNASGGGSIGAQVVVTDSIPVVVVGGGALPPREAGTEQPQRSERVPVSLGAHPG